MPTDAPSRKPESTSALGEKELSSSKPPPKSHKKMARESCFSSLVLPGFVGCRLLCCPVWVILNQPSKAVYFGGC